MIRTHYKLISRCPVQRKVRAYPVQAKVRAFVGQSATWYYVLVPKRTSQTIRAAHGGSSRGWGSIPVQVTMGKTVWKTSLFRDNKAGAYLMLLKASVRKAENVKHGKAISFQVAMGSV